MINTIIFLSLIFLFLSIMLMIDIVINVDLTFSIIEIKIKVYKITIITISIDILGLFYKINKSLKKKKISLIFTKEQEYLIKQIKSSILDKLYYDRLILKSEINMFCPEVNANIIGIYNNICLNLKTLFLNKNQDMKVDYSNCSKFVGNENYINLNIRVYFTIFDMFFAIIMSFYKRRRYVKQKNNK